MRERWLQPEILDGLVTDGREPADSLREVWGVNRFLGGMAVLRRQLRWLCSHIPASQAVTLLDVAGGNGDVAAALVCWAAAKGRVLQATILDNHPQVLEAARHRMQARPMPDQAPAIRVQAGDARRLPYLNESFDVVICNLVLHHFSAPEVVVVLRELHRVARVGWVVCDLERHPAAYWGARLLARTLWRNPITRHDGPLSVQRAFTAAEVRQLVRKAGVPAQVFRHPAWRLAVVSRQP